MVLILKCLDLFYKNKNKNKKHQKVIDLTNGDGRVFVMYINFY